MKREYIKDLRKNDRLRKHLAKYMARHCFRNTELENLHAGIAPSSKAGDYSDVKVVSPFGEIPWTGVSRFNDDEMKTLMIDVVDHCYEFLSLLFASPQGNRLVALLKERDAVPRWNEPQLPT